MNNKITLSASEFKALASETRTAIIKLLQQRNHTLSEISKKLGLAAPTVKQHLGVLESAQLVQGLEDGRKWKYYTLTRKGKNIFSPEQSTNILVILCTSIAALGAALYWFVLLLGLQAKNFAQTSNGLLQTPAVAAQETSTATDTIVAAGNATIQKAGETAFAVPISSIPLEVFFALLALVVFLSLLVGFTLGRIRK